MTDYEFPKNLYKFYKPTNLNISDIKNQKLFLAEPKKFNDPFDGKVADEVGLYFKILNSYFKKHHLIPTLEAYVEKMIIGCQVAENVTDEIFTRIILYVEGLFERENSLYKKEVITLLNELRRRILDREYKVSCFSGFKKNEKIFTRTDMWAYYANDGKGFCVVYDGTKLPIELIDNFYKVEYKKGIYGTPDFDCLDKYLINLHTKKTSNWQHEEEYRLILKLNETDVKIDFPYAKAIYIGIAANLSLIRKLKKIAEDLDIEFYCLGISSEKRKLVKM